MSLLVERTTKITGEACVMPRSGDDKAKVEIRPGVWMAYEDHWFGEPWRVPETVVMVHGNAESSRAWTVRRQRQ